jgi:hypothetical protein
VKSRDELRACQILFVGLTSDIQMQEWLRIAGQLGILTVGESPGFAAKGGMIGFTL